MGIFKLFSGFLILLCIIFLTETHQTTAKDDKIIHIYQLQKGNFSIKVTNYGATLLSLLVPDKNGKLEDIVLGYQNIEEYKNDTTYFGAIVGRVANRIGGARFCLEGKCYKLFANDGNNTLHGGKVGFSDVIWSVKNYQKDSHITFTYNSFDGEEGFPGNVIVEVTYQIIDTNKLRIKMVAKALNKPTPINLISHTYWNLAGHANKYGILFHRLQLNAQNYTPVDSNLIPNGQIKSINGTYYDFQTSQMIGSRIQKVPGGYDINYVLVDSSKGKHLIKAAVVEEKKSGRMMELWTNQPGIQLYTSNKISRIKGKDGAVYRKYAGLCLETQGFPDSVNHPNFPSQIVNPGQIYHHIMVYRFTANY
ncbi:galactose mutarotase-like [Impatiens glandulifera]|uniref:galactose mutarotase-like n=1 Tax=Impatiens glandulifera TaxID=253017 RepID=UPI001FB140D9|nr:galactose mutarotase-like [Impatiens glandulifera]